MIYANPADMFTAVLEGATSGLTTIGVRIENGDGSNHTPRTTVGVVELEASSGTYVKDDLAAPSSQGTYIILWDTGGANPEFASEELRVGFSQLETLTGDIRRLLELKVDADVEPELSSEDIDLLLSLARRPDEDGKVCTEEGWVETFDLDAAAAEGWRIKAGRASSRFSFAEDGQHFDRAQVFAHCVAQAEQYARKGMGAIPVGPGTAP
jgi:hypothetical protein